jgi:hypothetical protein
LVGQRKLGTLKSLDIKGTSFFSDAVINFL